MYVGYVARAARPPRACGRRRRREGPATRTRRTSPPARRAHIEAQGVRAEGGDVLLRGSLTDDAGAPLSDGALTIAIARASPPSGARGVLGASDGGAELARRTDKPRASSPDGALHLVTDDRGALLPALDARPSRSLRSARRVRRGRVRRRRPRSMSPVDLVPAHVRARLHAPEPRRGDLARREVDLALDATATLESDGVDGARRRATRSRSRPSSATGPVAAATTDAAGRARFTLDAVAARRRRGAASFASSFAGNADASAAARVAPIERRAQVDSRRSGRARRTLAGGRAGGRRRVRGERARGRGRRRERQRGGARERRGRRRGAGRGGEREARGHVRAPRVVGARRRRCPIALPLCTERPVVRAGIRRELASPGAWPKPASASLDRPGGARGRRVVHPGAGAACAGAGEGAPAPARRVARRGKARRAPGRAARAGRVARASHRRRRRDGHCRRARTDRAPGIRTRGRARERGCRCRWSLRAPRDRAATGRRACDRGAAARRAPPPAPPPGEPRRAARAPEARDARAPRRVGEAARAPLRRASRADAGPRASRGGRGLPRRPVGRRGRARRRTAGEPVDARLEAEVDRLASAAAPHAPAGPRPVVDPRALANPTKANR